METGIVILINLTECCIYKKAKTNGAFLRNRVMTMPTPWMAGCYSFNGQPASFK